MRNVTRAAVFLILFLTGMMTTSFCYAGPPRTIPADLDTAAFISNSCIDYQTKFRIEAPPEVWGEVIAHPYLYGQLWIQYGFHPRYQITMNGATIHIIDPTGIEGDIVLAANDDSTRIYLADGQMNNWGLPIGIEGRALFILTYTGGNGSVTGNMRIYGEGTGSFADIIIKMCSPILKHYINRRLTANIHDSQTILSDIASRPDSVRTNLAAVLRPEFDQMISNIGQSVHK